MVVSPRGISEDAKFTLHEDWDWWLAFDDERRVEELTGKLDREAKRWTPPEPNAGGWIHAISVWVPHGELSGVYGEQVKRAGRITWLDPAPPGPRVGIHLILASHNQMGARSDGHFVDGFTLADGRLLLIYRSMSALPVQTWNPIEGKRAEQCQGSDEPNAPVLRCMIGEHDDTRQLHLWDLAGLAGRPVPPVG